MKEEGRRKREEGSSATSNVRDVTDVTDVSPSEEGRRKKEGLPNFRPLALSPSLPLPFSAAIELLQCPIDLSPPQSMLYSAKIQ
ncbi:hypothetical protein QT995_27350 [Microcoleus sp. S36b_A3]|uniref:hypothetical protein n=1 Tax=unclassified Microcoleus TaxID=2642155 RepID=UPI002FD4B738